MKKLSKADRTKTLTESLFRRMRQESAREIKGYPLDESNVRFISKIAAALVRYAQALGRIKSPKKAAAARRNGKLGGRPRGKK